MSEAVQVLPSARFNRQATGCGIVSAVADSDWLSRVTPPRRTAFRALRQVSIACRTTANAFDRLASGLLTAADLRAAQQEEWRDFNATADRVAAGLMAWETRWYDACLKPGERVLLVGCGAGRDLIALAARGLRVDGLEPVPELAAAARRHAAAHGVAATIMTGAVENVDVSGYDAYVFSYFCYTYVRGTDARVAMLRSIRRASPTARALISAPSGERVNPLGTRLLRAANAIGRVDWRAEFGDVFGLDERAGFPRYSHAFDLPSLERELRAGGFRIARRVDDPELLLVEAQALG